MESKNVDETDVGSVSRIVKFVDYCVSWFFWPSVIVLLSLVIFLVARVYGLRCHCWWADIVAGLLAMFALMGAVFAVTKAWSKSASVETSSPKHTPPVIATRGIFVLTVIAVLLAFVYTIVLKTKYPSLCQRGVFGDAFGALNAIVSTVALIGLWLTVWLQYRQMREDRTRYVEDRRAEEQRRADDRLAAQKRKWPAVVVSKILGFVKLAGVDSDGNVTFKFQFEVEQTNYSDMVLINVVQNLMTSKSSDDSPMINLFTAVERFLLPQKSVSAVAEFVETSESGDLTTDALAECDNRVVHVNILLCTVQKSYYLISHRFKICVMKDVESIRVLRSWIDALSTIKGRISKHIVGKSLDQQLKEEFAVRGISFESQICLDFEPIPNRYKFIEISELDYMNAIEKKKCPYG